MYPGGKGSVYQKLINLIPPHSTYIETHVGGGSVMRAKRPARLNIGIDLDIAALEEMDRIVPGCIVVNGDALPGYIAKIDVPGAPPNMAMTAAIAKISDGAVPSNMAMSADTIKSSDVITSLKTAMLPAFRYVLMDAIAFLKEFPLDTSCFIYCDPPYLFETRSSKRPIYKFEYSEADHVRLLECLLSLPCNVMVSGYWSNLYAETLHDWHTFTFKAKTRSGRMADEWLWMNYPEPVKLHDYQYLGGDFRERERIKRRKTRWGKRLERMDVLERRAILWEMQERGLIE